MGMAKYVVTLNSEEREMLQNMINSGTERARKLTHARILLKAHEGWKDENICKALDVGIATVERVRKRLLGAARDESIAVSSMGNKRPV
jgi:DNA-directed RNA polymerase specialized sigma24 family protein